MSTARASAAAIIAERLVLIVRADSAEQAVRSVEALACAAVRIIEVSLATPGALSAIERVQQLGDGPVIGAGTVRSREDAEQATAAGARFLVSPGLDADVMKWASEHDMLYVPGVFSPTELERALAAGASLVKLFPAGRMGPAYVRDLLAPFPEAKLVPTGGIDSGNARSFLEAGAAAVAVGSAVINPTTLVDPGAIGRAIREMQTAIIT